MRVYNNYIDYIIKIVYTILLPLLIAVILVSVEGVYFIIYQSDGWTVQRQVGNTSTGMNHLFVLYPTGSLSESFLFTFILPFYMVSIGLFSFFAWHTFNTALMRYISFRLDVVKYRLENMLDYVDILLKNSQPAESAPQLPELLKAILISCVEDITEVRFFTNEYELVSRITLFFESSTISGLLCMQLYIISKDFFSGYGVYQFWCVATIGLLWLYYWHADEISQKSNEITNALYSFNWYEAPLPLQKDIALFMGSSMRPIIMKSGFINMNVNTFFTILKTSYSYFTLLQNFAK
ncbi:odorant receptor 56a-like [Hermetia illucens]|uniref:odorant receptor 56a-like n=1 Tax=Hermetia illucens TaxID=343691 RepID=UPI0018CC47C3|nr:odorant receptor 56a-like [Hermetia illucens]